MWFQEDWDHFWAGKGVRIWHLISPVSEFRMSDSWPLFYFKMLLALLIGGASGKETGCQCRNLQIPGSGGSPGGGPGNLFHYSCMNNPWAEVPGRLQSMESQRFGHN